MATSAEATRAADQITFAHNSERQFARLLDFYRVEWEYEPTAFPIEWDAAGRPTQQFRPDFYLPGFGLYIEITTLNQRLVTKKNRKVRRLRELYPDVRIKVLYQRDYLSLLAKYGLEPPSQMLEEPPGSSGPAPRAAQEPAGVVEGAQGGGAAAEGSGSRWPRVRGRRNGAGSVGRWSGRGRRGGRGCCPTRRSRRRRCLPTPSSSAWPRCSCRPSGRGGAVPPPSGPADPPAPGRVRPRPARSGPGPDPPGPVPGHHGPVGHDGPRGGALRGLRGRWFNRRALAGSMAAGQSHVDR